MSNSRPQAFWLRLAGDAGWGEGTIPPYYHVNQADTFATWEAAARRTDPFPDTLAEIAAWVGEDGPAPARCALDLALHDRIANDPFDGLRYDRADIHLPDRPGIRVVQQK